MSTINIAKTQFSTSYSSSNPQTISYTPNAAGNQLIVFFTSLNYSEGPGYGTVYTVSDTSSMTWTKICAATTTNEGIHASAWQAKTTGSSAITITLHKRTTGTPATAYGIIEVNFGRMTVATFGAVVQLVTEVASATMPLPSTSFTGTDTHLLLAVGGGDYILSSPGSPYTVVTVSTRTGHPWATLAHSISASSPFPSSKWHLNFTTAQRGALIVDIPVLASAPLAPTLQSPTNGAYVTAASGVTFKSKYNSTDGAAANAYALRFKLSSASTYKYWNGTGTQSTVYWNAATVATGASQSVTLPNTLIANGNTYVWSMAYRESDATLTGTFASNFTVHALAPPTLTVSAPTGTQTTGRPLVTWTATPSSGGSIVKYRVKVFSAAQYGAAGFTPGTSTAVYTTGTVSGSTSSKIIGTTLVNGTSYRAYVRVAETGTTYSAWVYSAFSVSITTPLPPTVTAIATTASTGYPVIKLTIDSHNNLLTATTASAKSGVGLWVDTADATVGRGSPPVTVPTGPGEAISLTSTAAATMSAKTSAGVAGIIAGQSYTVQAKFLAGTSETPKTCHITYTWLKTTNTVISSGTTPVVLDSTSVWTKTLAHVTAPALAAKIELKATITTAASSQEHWMCDIGVNLGTITVWGQGGFVGNTKCVVTRHYATTGGITWYLRGASTLNRAAVPTTQVLTLYDFECIPNVEYHYTVVEIVTSTASASSPITTSTVEIVPNTQGWWMVICTQTTKVCNANPITLKPQVTEQSTAHLVLGQAYPNVVSSSMGGQDGTATFETFNKTNYTNLQYLLQSQQVVFMQNPYATAYTPTYVRFGPQSGGMSSGYGNKVKTGKLNPSSATAPHHNTSITWVAQPRPPV